jgi:exonuclease III
VKVLSWNILQGGGRRVEAIAQSVERHDADVVALTEYRIKGSAALVRRLREAGWVHVLATDPPGNDYGLCVLSRVPVSRVESGAEMPCGGVRWLEAMVWPGGFTLGVAYILPHAGREAARKQADWDALLAAMARRVGSPYLLVGDLNTDRRCLEDPRRTLPCADRFEALGESGWVDVWRRGRSGSEGTWVSHAGTAYRLDHAFASPGLAARVTGCRYSHEEREAGLSDHSVLVVEVGS